MINYQIFTSKETDYTLTYDQVLKFDISQCSEGLKECVSLSHTVCDTNQNKWLVKLRSIKASMTRKANEGFRKYSTNSFISSCSRSKNRLQKILDNNKFNLFATFTFDKKIINREDDTKVRAYFRNHMRYITSKLPSLFYIAVPEYHKKGSLHYHLLIGGVSYEDLKPYHIKGERTRKGTKLWRTKYWRAGRSDLQIIENETACKCYISKYIMKFTYDVRFFNKRKYSFGGNIQLPINEVFTVKVSSLIDRGIDVFSKFLDDFVYNRFVDFYNKSIFFMKSTTDFSNLIYHSFCNCS